MTLQKALLVLSFFSRLPHRDKCLFSLSFRLPLVLSSASLLFWSCLNMAGHFRKYWSGLLVLDLMRMSGLMFASTSGSGLSHVKHQNVLQFFLETSYSVFRWEILPVSGNKWSIELILEGKIIFIQIFLGNLCSMFLKFSGR